FRTEVVAQDRAEQLQPSNPPACAVRGKLTFVKDHSRRGRRRPAILARHQEPQGSACRQHAVRERAPGSGPLPPASCAAYQTDDHRDGVITHVHVTDAAPHSKEWRAGRTGKVSRYEMEMGGNEAAFGQRCWANATASSASQSPPTGTNVQRSVKKR